MDRGSTSAFQTEVVKSANQPVHLFEVSVDEAATVNAGSFTIGSVYLIRTVGDTDFTAIGASSNTTGIVFTATGVGTGTGTASERVTVYANDGYKSITYSGNDYLALGHFIGFSDIEEAAEIIVSSVTLSLSGVDQVWISTLLSEDYIDRPVKIYLGFLDGSQSLLADPVLIFEGRMDQPVISDDPNGGESMISISATNAWVDFSRKTGRHTNHEEQQIHFAGDKGFEYASEVVKDMIWGKK